SLLRKRRIALHGQIAKTLEHLYTQLLDEHLPQLVHHYSLSDDQERALQYLLRFGDKAARMYANQDAVSCYRRALELLEQQSNRSALKAGVLERLADAHSALGEPEAARKSWEVGLLLYETLREEERLAAIHRKIGLHWWGQGDREKAVEHFHEGLALLANKP